MNKYVTKFGQTAIVNTEQMRNDIEIMQEALNEIQLWQFKRKAGSVETALDALKIARRALVELKVEN